MEELTEYEKQRIRNSKNFYGAYLKGKKARIDGLTENDNPYKDKRKKNGKLTWSRAFKNMWFAGFHGWGL